MKIIKTITFAILTFIISTNTSFINARTIVLIYDNSGSMQNKCIERNNKNECIKREYYLKYAYANYAAQMLTAYLKKTDKFIPILMNEPEKTNFLDIQINRQRSLDYIKEKWAYSSGCTPYQTIQQGFRRLLADDNFSDEKEQHFLIVMTDGKFEGECDKPVAQSIIEQDSNEAIDKTKGRIKVIFLLIGKETKNQPTFLIWDRNAPEKQVIPFFAENEKEIITQMKNIALMITGMQEMKFDKQSNNIQGGIIQFKTIFPLNRITVSIQSTRDTPPQAQNVFFSQNSVISDMKSEHLNISYDAARKVPLKNIDNEVNLKAQVTHYTSSNFLKGDYTIILDKPLTREDEQNVQILLETAIKTNITIIGQDGDPIHPIQGEIKTCKDDLLRAAISFQDPDGNFIPFSHAMSDEIDIRVFFDQIEFKVNKRYDDKKKMFITNNSFRVYQSKTNFYAEVVYPQYFSYKSNVISIIGDNCANRMFENSNKTVDISYIMSDSYVPISDAVSFTVTSKGKTEYVPGAKDVIEVSGLPQGLTLRINNMDMMPSNNKVTVPMLRIKDLLRIQILRNKDYCIKDSVKVHLKMIQPDQLKYKWGNYPIITMNPQPRNISLQATSAWKVPVDQIESKPLMIAVQLNNHDLLDEFQQWQIQCDDFAWLPVDTFKDHARSIFYIAPYHPFNCQCVTATGIMDMTCHIQGVFQKEVYTVPLKLEITEVSLIKKCYGLAILILLFITIVWWIIGILKKPRFQDGRCITYKVIEKKTEIKSRTEPLVTHWFKRWLIPYIPEKKEIRSFTFYPGPFNTAMIPKKQMRKNIYIDGIVQNLPWQYDLKLSLNATLTHDHGDRKELYVYN
jgi:hypothetical protein